MTVKNLLINAAEGDNEAFQEFMSLYRPKMKQFADMFTRDGDDIVQDVCERLCMHRERLAKIENIDNWLFYVIRNRCYDEARRKKYDISYEYNVDYVDKLFCDGDILEKIIAKEDKNVITRYIDELPEALKLPILLHYFEQIPVTDVVRILNVPYTTAKWRMHAARLKLKEKIIKERFLL